MTFNKLSQLNEDMAIFNECGVGYLLLAWNGSSAEPNKD